MAWSFSIASLDWLIALWLVLMGRSLSLNRTIFKLYRDIYSQVVFVCIPSYVWNYVAFPIRLVWRPMVSDTVYVPIQGLLTRPLLTMRQREHLLEPSARDLVIEYSHIDKFIVSKKQHSSKHNLELHTKRN
jgi:hypothetical protein